jgi:hypothetical protein
MDTATGEVAPLRTHTEERRCVADLALPAGGHALWLCSGTPVGVPARIAATNGESVAMTPVATVRSAPNVLFLDYCDLTAEGKRFSDINTLRADGLNWRLQGFAQNPWQGAHQFERTFIDHPVPSDSSFSVTYRFAVSQDLPDDRRSELKAGVERSWLYDVALNGRSVDQAAAEPWFDEHMRALPIGPAVRPGDNELTLTAKPFHMLCEIMPVYIIGDFCLKPVTSGFEVTSSSPIGLGDWTVQGMPFYAGVLRYCFTFRLAEICERLSLSLGRWDGSVAAVSLDGSEAGILYPLTEQLGLDGPFAAGEHELGVDVHGNMRNMMGPHHAEGLPGAWTWAQCPDHRPPGSEYCLQPSGLHDIPSVEVS